MQLWVLYKTGDEEGATWYRVVEERGDQFFIQAYQPADEAPYTGVCKKRFIIDEMWINCDG